MFVEVKEEIEECLDNVHRSAFAGQRIASIRQRKQGRKTVSVTLHKVLNSEHITADIGKHDAIVIGMGDDEQFLVFASHMFVQCVGLLNGHEGVVLAVDGKTRHGYSSHHVETCAQDMLPIGAM